MATGIQRLAKQAWVTFMPAQSASFASNIESLKAMMESITASDINLPLPIEEESEDRTHFNGRYTQAPASHVSIYECQYFSLGVFILHKECAIPLHDHPGMFGICKPLYGKVKIRSFNRMSQSDKDEEIQHYNSYAQRRSPFKCSLNTEETYDANSGSCFLTPTVGNYHTIINTSQGSCAFLDILAPPYAPEKGRDCMYYKECDPPIHSKLSQKDGLSSEDRERVRWLVQISPPREFYCDAEPYLGPRINL